MSASSGVPDIGKKLQVTRLWISLSMWRKYKQAEASVISPMQAWRQSISSPQGTELSTACSIEHRKEGKTMQDMSLAADRFNAVMLRENHILSVDVFVGWQAGKQKSSKLSGSLQDQGSCLYVKFAAHCRCRHRFWRGPSADVRHQTIWPCWILCRQIIDDPLRTWWVLHR